MQAGNSCLWVCRVRDAVIEPAKPVKLPGAYSHLASPTIQLCAAAAKLFVQFNRVTMWNLKIRPRKKMYASHNPSFKYTVPNKINTRLLVPE